MNLNPFEKAQKEDSLLKGSGARAMETNNAALDQIQKDMEALRVRFDAGEDISGELQRLKKLREKILQDMGKIAEAGI